MKMSANLAAYFAGLKCESARRIGSRGRIGGPGDRIEVHRLSRRRRTRAAIAAWPNLAGQSKDYLVNALKAYKSGARNNGMMAGIVKDLSDADAENVAAYYASATCK